MTYDYALAVLGSKRDGPWAFGAPPFRHRNLWNAWRTLTVTRDDATGLPAIDSSVRRREGCRAAWKCRPPTTLATQNRR